MPFESPISNAHVVPNDAFATQLHAQKDLDTTNEKREGFADWRWAREPGNVDNTAVWALSVLRVIADTVKTLMSN